jgi:hypothetical protein
MPRERTQPVCDAFAAALRTHGVPQQVLTDNGKVFTGRFGHPPVEVLFDRICRENGIEHLLTAPRSPTTTGKIERFHRSLRAEFLTGRVFSTLAQAQAELDAWAQSYNHDRPHQSLDMATPASRFLQRSDRAEPELGPWHRTAPATPGYRGSWHPTASSASPGNRSASGSTTPAAASTCTSPTRCCSCGMAPSY